MLKSVSLSRLVAVLISLWILQQANGRVSRGTLVPSDFQVVNLELNSDGAVNADVFISQFLEERINSTILISFEETTSLEDVPQLFELTSFPRQPIGNGSVLYRVEDILQRDRMYTSRLTCQGSSPFISTDFETTNLTQVTTLVTDPSPDPTPDISTSVPVSTRISSTPISPPISTDGDFQILNLELNSEGRVTADIFISDALVAGIDPTLIWISFTTVDNGDGVDNEDEQLFIQLTSLPMLSRNVYTLNDTYALQRDRVYRADLTGLDNFISTEFETTNLRQSTTGTPEQGSSLTIVIICVSVLATLLLLCVILIIIAIACVTHRRRTHKLMQMSVSETESIGPDKPTIGLNNQTVYNSYEAGIRTSANSCYGTVNISTSTFTGTNESSHTHTELTTQASVHLYDDIPPPSTSQTSDYIMATPIYDNYDNVDPSNGFPITPDPSPRPVKSSWIIPPRRGKDTLSTGINKYEQPGSGQSYDQVADYEIPSPSRRVGQPKHS